MGNNIINVVKIVIIQGGLLVNYLDKLLKNIKYKQKNQKAKVNFLKGFAVFSVLSVVIGGVTTRLLAQSRLEEKKNNIISNSKDNNEDIKLKRDEIKHTLEEFGDEVVGDVGVAMEKALEGLEDEKQSENEIAE